MGQFVGGGSWSVTVTIRRPEGAGDLERKLAEVGIPADVEFPRDGMRCAPGRFSQQQEVDNDRSAPAVTDVSLSRDESKVVAFPARWPQGVVLVIAVAYLEHVGETTIDGKTATMAKGISGRVATVRGKVGPCRLVSLSGDDFIPSESPTPSR